MAKASWLSVAPASGSGNGSVEFSATAHTGRTARSTVATFSAAGVSDKVVNVSQAGKAEFVQIAATASAAKGGGTVTISGTSNSTKLNFTLGTGALVITLPTNYTANSVSTANNATITGDPGASAQFAFSVAITVPNNTGITELTKQIIVTDAGGHTGTCTLTQAAGDPTLSVSPATIELTAAGTAVSATVTSNTNWTVS